MQPLLTAAVEQSNSRKKTVFLCVYFCMKFAQGNKNVLFLDFDKLNYALDE